MADLENHSINEVFGAQSRRDLPAAGRRKESVAEDKSAVMDTQKSATADKSACLFRDNLRKKNPAIPRDGFPCAAAYGCDHNSTAIDTSTILYRRLRGSDYHYRSIPPVLPGVIDIQILRICHPNPHVNKKRETNFPFLSMF
jgi:hypothetical protein